MSNFKLFVLHVEKQTLLFGVLSLILLGGGWWDDYVYLILEWGSKLINGSETHMLFKGFNGKMTIWEGKLECVNQQRCG